MSKFEGSEALLIHLLAYSIALFQDLARACLFSSFTSSFLSLPLEHLLLMLNKVLHINGDMYPG